MTIKTALATICLAIPGIALAQIAPTPAPTAMPTVAYTTENTDIATILADPKVKAIIAKHLPKLVADERIEQAGSMTIKMLQNYTPDVTDEILGEIDADVAALSISK